MSPAEFLRVYHLRAPHLMWLLGAGASAASGILTARDMIWDFKRRIYCSEQKVPLRTCEDLGDARLLDKIQAFFDRQGTCPPRDSLEEYAFYFSRVYPGESDRRKYIEELTSMGTRESVPTRTLPVHQPQQPRPRDGLSRSASHRHQARDGNGLRRGDREVETYSAIRCFTTYFVIPYCLLPLGQSLAGTRMPVVAE